MAVVVTLLDVTDQKENEDKIRAQEVSLMMASRLSGLGEMAAGIAHEINNPLAIISGRVGLIQDSLSNSDVDIEFVKRNTQTIENTVARIVKIVSSMKSLSRHTPNDNFIKSSINAILDDVVEISRQRIRTCEIDLQVEQTEDFLFDCYPGQISQVILNLMNNSIDAIEKFESKWIRISVSKDDSFVFFKIADCGEGIPLPIRNKILEPFFTTKEVGKGTGLGLSLVQAIVRKHNGEFRINDLAKNTEFVIQLPLKQF